MKIISSHKVRQLACENESFKQECKIMLQRHRKGDFGLVDTYIITENLNALKTGNKEVFSAYRSYYGKVWVITLPKEDKTVIMFPEEYRAEEKYGKRFGL